MKSGKLWVAKATVALFLVAFFLSFSLPSFGLSVSTLFKERTVKRGSVHRGTIRVSNAGEEPVTVRVNQTDYLFYADGTNRQPPPGEVARSNAPWIEWDLGDSRLTVPAKSTVAVGYTLRVPDDPKLEGTYWSMVHITPVPGEAKRVKQGVTVRHVFGYGIQIVTQIGDTGSRKIEVIGAKAVEGKEKGKSFFQVDIKNTGQRSLRPVVYLEVYDEQGKLLDKLESPRGRVRIYPGCSVRHRISLSQLDPGKYPAMLVIDNLDRHVWGAKVDIKVSK